MKINSTKIITQRIVSIILLVVFSIIFSLQNISHASGTIYFEPSSINAQKDNIVTVKILANSSNFVAAQVDVSYDSTVLEYSSQSLANSVLPTAFGPTPGNGVVKTTLYTTKGPVSGSNLKLISLSFKVLKENTTTILKFLPTTSLNYQDAKVASGSNQANIIISGTSATSAPSGNNNNTQNTQSNVKSQNVTTATQPPTSITDSINTSAPETPTVVVPSSDKDAPKIISAVPIGFADGIVSIKITTDEPTTASVKFGEKENLYNSRYSVDFSTSYFVPLAEVDKFFNQGNNYYFTAEVIDAAGNKTISEKKELVVEPVNVTITLQDESGAILANTTIIVNGKEFTTDDNGLVTIEGILPGSVAISLKQGDKSIYIGEVTAVKGVKNQSYTVTPKEIIVTTKPQYLDYLLPTAIIIGGAIAILLVLRRIKNNRAQQQIAYTTQPIKPWDPTANIQTRQSSIPPQQPSNSVPTNNQPSNPNPVNSGAVITPTVNNTQPQQLNSSSNQSQQPNSRPNNPQEQTQVVNNLPEVQSTPQANQQDNQQTPKIEHK